MLGSFLAPLTRITGGAVGETRSRAGELVGFAAHAANTVVRAPFRAVSDKPVDWRGHDLTEQVRHALELVRGRARSVWVGDGRLHAQLSVTLSTDDAGIAHLETSLLARRGVEWAAVNGVAQRVVVAYDPSEVTPQELVAVVDEVDEAWQETEAELPVHPADVAPLLRQLVSLGADTASLTLAMIARFSPLPALPAGLTVTAGLLENAPRLRGVIEARLGSATADLTLSVFTAVVAGLGQGPLGPAIDILHRAGIATEISARRASWKRREPELCDDPVAAKSEPVSLEPRPVEIPDGPIETYAERAWFASLAAAGITLPATRTLERASAALAAGMPKAARLGREAFAIHLGRVLAQHGILVFDSDALRLLDRVDVVVVESRLLHPDDVRLVGEIVPVGDLAGDRAREWVAELFDPEDPDVARRRGEWALTPFEKALVELDSGLHQRVRDLERRGSTVLALTRRDELVALVETRYEYHAIHDRVVTAVAEAGLALALATSDSDDEPAGVEAEWVLPEGEALVAAIQRLQRDGHVVCVVASRNHRALAAADVGVGIRPSGEPPPWTAHLMCRDDVTDALIVVEACAAAREVSVRSVRLAASGAGMGAFFVLRGIGATTRPVLVAVHVASLAALANGAWSAISLGRRPRPREPDRAPWHVMDADRVLEHLGTSREGLSPREAAQRQVLPSRTRPAPLVLGQAVVEELNNPLTSFLLAGAGLSAVVGSVVDASMITGVVVLNGLLGGLQRFRTEQAIGELGRVESRRVTVVRDGEVKAVDAVELVPGDVIRLEAGEGVPADCRILEGSGLEVDESTLTGESGTVIKGPEPSLAVAVAERSSMLYDGTYIAAGSATAVVVGVGPATEARRAFFVGEKQVESGVEARLNSLTSLTIPAALLSGVGVVGAGLLQGQPVSATARGGVGLVAAAVPEGLPLLATTAQLASAQRLSARGALVRDPRSIEALGRVDLLCADKTGTLTEGRLELRAVSDGSVEESLDKLSGPRRRVLAAGLRATPAERSGAGNGDGASGETSQTLPHPTDQVIISGARVAGVRIDEGAEGWTRHDELPFEPARGYHATLGRAERSSGPEGGSTERTLLSVKGAPEVILPRCTHRFRDGQSRHLDAATRRRLGEQVDRVARKGHRVLAVAERELPSGAEPSDNRVAELTFEGFLAISDPVRPAAAAAISELRQAGVEVAMITGDHPSTAEGIAAELGLLNGEDIATGPQIDALDDDELEALIDEARVFARVTPAHKVRIVEAFQRLGRVVAMTGDGANDAPAIRLADAGIAVGERGTSAARDAADLVVFDDRIEIIVDAIVEGRAMWSSVREAVAILVGGNLGEIGFTLAASLLSGQPPLNARQLLLVNLLTDVAPAITIALRPPVQRTAEDLLNEGPEASLGEALNRTILWRAATTAGGASAAWGIARLTGTSGRARTVGLVGLVLTQLGQTLAVGGRSPAVMGASLGSAALLATVVQTPGLSQLVGCRPLGPVGWATGIGAATVATGASLLVPRLASTASDLVPRLAARAGSPSSTVRRSLPAPLAQPSPHG